MSIKFEAPIIKTVPGKYDEENIILEIEKNSANPPYVINQEEVSSNDYYLKNIPSLFVPVCAVHNTDSTDVYILLSNYEFILLNTSTMTTTKLANPPVNYKQCSMIIKGSLIYIFGGVTSASSGAGTTAIYAYNMSTKAWTSSLGTLTRAVVSPTLINMWEESKYSSIPRILVFGGRASNNTAYRGQVYNVMTQTITDSQQWVINSSRSHFSRNGTSITIQSGPKTKPFELMISGDFISTSSTKYVLPPYYLDIHTSGGETIDANINTEIPNYEAYQYNYTVKLLKSYEGTAMMKFAQLAYDGKIFSFGPEAETQMILEINSSNLVCKYAIEPLEPLYSGVFPVTINYTDPYILCIPLYAGNKLYKIQFKEPAIVYTSDGSDPDTSATAKVYTEKTNVPLSKSTQIKAITKIV